MTLRPHRAFTPQFKTAWLERGPAKIPDDVIVIDHVDKPTEN